jgi:hypothetical protein
VRAPRRLSLATQFCVIRWPVRKPGNCQAQIDLGPFLDWQAALSASVSRPIHGSLFSSSNASSTASIAC